MAQGLAWEGGMSEWVWQSRVKRQASLQRLVRRCTSESEWTRLTLTLQDLVERESRIRLSFLEAGAGQEGQAGNLRLPRNEHPRALTHTSSLPQWVRLIPHTTVLPLTWVSPVAILPTLISHSVQYSPARSPFRFSSRASLSPSSLSYSSNSSSLLLLIFVLHVQTFSFKYLPPSPFSPGKVLPLPLF